MNATRFSAYRMANRRAAKRLASLRRTLDEARPRKETMNDVPAQSGSREETSLQRNG